MKKVLAGGLRIVLPLALGLWLVYYFYQQLEPAQRVELFHAFRSAQWGWLVVCLVLGWFSHLSRAWRWRYLLKHLGHEVPLSSAYHATMIGYFMNLLLPRAGEASRAMAMQRAEKVPFAQGFGTILAERAVDMIALLLIGATTLLLQIDKIGLFQERIAAFRGVSDTDATGGLPAWLPWVAGALLLSAVLGGYWVLSRPVWRARVRAALTGLMDGVRSVLHTPDKGWFIAHSILIWVLYVAMFAVGFQALESTKAVPMAGIMAGFVAGTIGIVLVQGGIGVYPAFVALIVSIYLPLPEGGGIIRPDALAIGWLLWVAQTGMLIVLGGLSLLLIRSRKTSVGP